MISTFNLICIALAFGICMWTMNMHREPIGAARWVTQREVHAAILLLCIGAIMRGVQLWLARHALLPDEIALGLHAESLWNNGVDLAGKPWSALLPSWSNEPVGPLYAWIIMPLMASLGHNVLALRLPMLLLQMVSLWVLWDLIRRAFGSRAALWTLFLAVVSPWQLMQARWAMGWQLLPHLMLLSIWMIVRGRYWYFAGMVVLAMAMYTGDTAWYIVPAFCLVAGLCLWKMRGASLRRVFSGLILFGVLAAPSLYAWAAHTFDLPERQVLSLNVPRVPNYAHASDWLLDKPRDVTTTYSDTRIQPQQGYGPQFLPILRDDWHVATLHTALFEAGYTAIKGTVLQYTDDPDNTAGYFSPDEGYLYLFSLPLILLGAVRFLVRRSKSKVTECKEVPSVRRMTKAMLLAWCVSALLFYMTHLNLSLPHYAAAFYPLLLCAAYGGIGVAQRSRVAGTALLALYVAGLVAFWVQGYNSAPAFPGLQAALEHVRALDAPHVAVTTRLYPHASPLDAAKLNTQWVLGEDARKVDRVEYAYFPVRDFSADKDVAYVMHESEEVLLDTTLYDVAYFDQFLVASPLK